MLDYSIIYDTRMTFKSYFWCEKLKILLDIWDMVMTVTTYCIIKYEQH